jgi:hypothetical protein
MAFSPGRSQASCSVSTATSRAAASEAIAAKRSAFVA